jgi:GlpG protein
MRFLTTLAGRKKTERFVAYLISQNISTHVEQNAASSESWDLWIREEDRMGVAKNSLAEYEANPDDQRFANAVTQAESVLQERQAKKAKAAKQIKTGRETFQRDLIGGTIPPITLTLILISVFVSLVTQFTHVTDVNSYGHKLLDQLYFVNPMDYRVNLDPAASLKKFQLWRLVTPIFIHVDALHILFNGFMMASLGRLTERLEGPATYAMIVFIIAIFSNALQGLLPQEMMGNPIFGGLSGVAYGLFGYIWVRTTLNPQLGIELAPGLILIMLAWLILTMTGAIAINTANLCHLGGLVCGGALAYFMTQFNTARR